MKINLFIAFSIVVLTFCGSCNIYNPAEPVPAYIHIDNITLTIADPSSAGQGSASSKISDAWIYVDEQLIGCFQMPCTVPVIGSGNHVLKIKTGIKVNGISATRAPYPFYSDYTQVVNLQPGATTIIKGATVTYNPYLTGVAHFPLIEDFESSGFNVDSTHDSQTPLVRVSSPAANVFEGTQSAVGSLRSSNYVFECSSIQFYPLNKSGAPVFLEFNYKCNHVFDVVVRGNTMSGSTITNTALVGALSFNPSENWNKEYLYLTPAISNLGNASLFKIYFRMINPEGADSLGLALDNIKIVQ